MRFIWLQSARAELRAIDRSAAIRILHALTRYSESGQGDIRNLEGEFQGHFRLRAGDYRVVFRQKEDTITIVRVRHRSESYR